MNSIGQDGSTVCQYTAYDFNQCESKIDEKGRLDVFNGACVVVMATTVVIVIMIIVLMHRCLHNYSILGRALPVNRRNSV